jgi:hypothetical protein
MAIVKPEIDPHRNSELYRNLCSLSLWLYQRMGKMLTGIADDSKRS